MVEPTPTRIDERRDAVSIHPYGPSRYVIQRGTGHVDEGAIVGHRDVGRYQGLDLHALEHGDRGADVERFWVEGSGHQGAIASNRDDVPRLRPNGLNSPEENTDVAGRDVRYRDVLRARVVPFLPRGCKQHQL